MNIYREDCLCLSPSACPSVSMHSHSFQDTELKLHRYVNDSPGQVVEGLKILRYPMGLRNEWLNQSKNVNLTCIRTVSKIYRVETSQIRQYLSGIGRGGDDDSTVPGS